MEQIKLIWDFRGPNAQPIAEHHKKHLEEFIITEEIPNATCHIINHSEMYTSAYMIIDKSYMQQLRDQLQPHRGQLHKE